LNITVFLPSLAGAGAERVMVSLANGFSSHGHQVSVVLAESDGPMGKGLNERVGVTVLGSQNVAFSLFRFSSYLKANQPDVILSALYVPNLIALMAVRLFGLRIPVIATEHSSLSSVLETRSTVRRWLLKHLVRKLYPKAAKVVCVSPGIVQEMAMLYRGAEKNATTIANPIDVTAIQKHVAQVANRALTEPKILCVGRLVKLKRFDDVIRAFSAVRESIACKLEIVGDGPERENLETLCNELGLRDEVSFTGFLPDPYSNLADASIVVVSSEIEGFGNVIVEALALGVQVVATDCPHGPRFILEDAHLGRLVPVGDVDALAQAILDTLDHPVATPEQLKARAAYFDAGVAVDAYLELIEQVTSSARQSR